MASAVVMTENDMPDVMYGWRVKALDSWLAARENGSGRLSMEEVKSLGHLDQYHYRGLKACDECASVLGLDSRSRVLDVGAGVGGPARYLAHTTGCEVVGVELQKQLVDAGDRLNQATGLSHLVSLVCGDMCNTPPSAYGAEYQFTHVISLLVILHIRDRAALFDKLQQSLVDGGVLFIEDMVLTPGAGAWTEEESELIHKTVGAAFIPSEQEYREHLEAAGFVDVAFLSLTDEWAPWAIERAVQYGKDEERQVASNGEAVFKDRMYFYNAVSRLFQSGKLGGSRVTARKPSEWERKLRQGLSSEAGIKLGKAEASIIEGASGCASAGHRDECAVPFPLAQHDNWQWHFYPRAETGGATAPGGEVFVAVRLWRSSSLSRAWAWIFDGERVHTVVEGDVAEAVSPRAGCLDMSVRDGASGGVYQVSVRDDFESEGVICVSKAGGGASVLEVRFNTQVKTEWEVPGQAEKVIHRPLLAATVAAPSILTKSPPTVSLHGYSKRYYGPYPHFWSYRFITFVGKDQASGEAKGFWTADATFGASKYNYWKDFSAEDGKAAVTHHEEKQHCFHQMHVGHCLGREVHLKSPFAKRELNLRSERSDSLMSEAFWSAEVVDKKTGNVVMKGYAFNEHCMGTI